MFLSVGRAEYEYCIAHFTGYFILCLKKGKQCLGSDDNISIMYAVVQNKGSGHDLTVQCCLIFAGGKAEELSDTNYHHLASSPPTHILVQPPPNTATSSPLYAAASSKYNLRKLCLQKYVQ